mgnify:CR=1 FL=1|tara:strand:+ start:805 stop:1077 length:273 start_codon:yes stop_codon:yes gene_type:complete
MKLKLPIFHHSDETRKFSELDIDYNIEECETQEIIFYRIDAIAPAENNKYCSVFTGGEEFVCALSLKEVELLINKSIGPTLEEHRSMFKL